MNIITICSLKGGTGKSTIASLLARITASQGLHTLVIDTDPQHSFTSLTIYDPIEKTLLDAVAGNSLVLDCIIPGVRVYERLKDPTISVLPATPDLSQIREYPQQDIAGAIHDASQNFDVTIVDTAGIIDNITHALFSISSKVAIPVGYSIADISATQEFIEAMTTAYPLIEYTLIVNRVSRRESDRSNQYYDSISQLGGITSVIPDSTLIRNAIENRTKISNANKYSGISPAIGKLQELVGTA